MIVFKPQLLRNPLDPAGVTDFGNHESFDPTNRVRRFVNTCLVLLASCCSSVDPFERLRK